MCKMMSLWNYPSSFRIFWCHYRRQLPFAAWICVEIHIIGPWGISIKFYVCNFQTDFSDWWLRHLLWNCPSLNVTGLKYEKSTLVQVMAWRRQATSHYPSQCWSRSLSPYGFTRPQRVKQILEFLHHFYNVLNHSWSVILAWWRVIFFWGFFIVFFLFLYIFYITPWYFQVC